MSKESIKLDRFWCKFLKVYVFVWRVVFQASGPRWIRSNPLPLRILFSTGMQSTQSLPGAFDVAA